MGYRDELDAARARIAVLEEELAGHDVAARSEEKQALVARANELAERLAAAEAQAERMRAAMRVPAAGMKTLTEHNRQFPTKRTGTPAGVLCPLCAALGDHVEMWRDSGLVPAVNDRDRGLGGLANSVMCPRCRYMGFWC